MLQLVATVQIRIQDYSDLQVIPAHRIQGSLRPHYNRVLKHHHLLGNFGGRVRGSCTRYSSLGYVELLAITASTPPFPEQKLTIS